MIKTLFCPRCGSSASLNKNQEMTCHSTGATLGRIPTSELLEWASSEPAADDYTLGRTIGIDWHCPACSYLCQESEGKIFCPECQRYLTRFAFYLTELYPHS